MFFDVLSLLENHVNRRISTADTEVAWIFPKRETYDSASMAGQRGNMFFTFRRASWAVLVRRLAVFGRLGVKARGGRGGGLRQEMSLPEAD